MMDIIFVPWWIMIWNKSYQWILTLLTKATMTAITTIIWKQKDCNLQFI